MTEELASTPGWVDERLDRLFFTLPQSEAAGRARQDYAICIAGRKQPGIPSDQLGAEFSTCRADLHRALQLAGIAPGKLDAELEALEAEIAAGS